MTSQFPEDDHGARASRGTVEVDPTHSQHPMGRMGPGGEVDPEVAVCKAETADKASAVAGRA